MPRNVSNRMQNRRAPRRASRPRSSESLRSLGSGPRQSWSSPNGSFPDRATVELQYSKSVRVNPGVVTRADQVFHINSLFDPDVSAAGHQPREFDTWATVYGKYRVHRCRYQVWIRQRASHGIKVVLVPNTVVTDLTAAGFPGELPRAVVAGIAGSNQPVIHHQGEFACNAILGQTLAQYRANEQTAALVSANPAESLYLHVFVEQLDAATVLDYEMEIRLSFFAELFDRQVVGPSALIRRLQDMGGLPLARPEDDDDLDPPPSPSERASSVRSAFPPLATSGEVRAAARAATRVYPCPPMRH